MTNVTEVAKLHPEDQAQVPTLPSESLLLSFPENYLEPRWYAVYTIARHEKRVAEQMDTPVAGQSAISGIRPASPLKVGFASTHSSANQKAPAINFHFTRTNLRLTGEAT